MTSKVNGFAEKYLDVLKFYIKIYYQADLTLAASSRGDNILLVFSEWSGNDKTRGLVVERIAFRFQ